jgi:molybdate/tungstate transport system substrate-binding protein
MKITRRAVLAVPPALLAAGARPAWAAGSVTVVYAGSMGVVMDKGLGPAFTAETGIAFHGIGQAAMALARLLAAKSMTADVFVSVSAGPVKVVESAGLEKAAVPVASTDFVLAYSPHSKFASAFQAAGPAGWVNVLTSPGLRYGRTDPTVDPQGAYNLYCLQLAALYYKMPGFAEKVAGPMLNPAQIFAEPSLLARLQDGQIDATLGYESAVISQKLPYIKLPPEINFSSPALAKTWYEKATLVLKGKPAHPSPLVFYAAPLANAPNPAAARAFAQFLSTPKAQGIFKQFGYNPGLGKPI